jgi:hypothetical protein
MVGKTVGEQLDQSSEMADTKLYFASLPFLGLRLPREDVYRMMTVEWRIVDTLK